MCRWVPPIAVAYAFPMTFAFLSAQFYAGDTLPSALITALFEVLSFPALMDDLKINQALEAALLHLKQSHELALTDGGRYQGLYRLMAHPSPQIRAMVSVLCGPITFLYGPITVCQTSHSVLLDTACIPMDTSLSSTLVQVFETVYFWLSFLKKKAGKSFPLSSMANRQALGLLRSVAGFSGTCYSVWCCQEQGCQEAGHKPERPYTI